MSSRNAGAQVRTLPARGHADRLRRVPSVPQVLVQGSLALDHQPLLDPPTPEVAPGRPGSDLVSVPEAMRQHLHGWAARHLQAVVEIVQGDRPVAQLQRWCLPTVHQDLARRALLVARAGAHRPGEGRGPGAVRPHLLGVRISVVRPDAFEASAHVRYGERSRALAARYECRGGRWLCVALQFA